MSTEMPKPTFRVGTRFMAPDETIATVVHVVMDGFMPVYNLTIEGDPGMDHGHIAEYELFDPGWKVCAPGQVVFVPIVKG